MLLRVCACAPVQLQGFSDERTLADTEHRSEGFHWGRLDHCIQGLISPSHSAESENITLEVTPFAYSVH